MEISKPLKQEACLKTVIHLLRHAKAEKPNGDAKFPDFYRPLGADGVNQALRLRRQLADENVLVRLGLSSPAPRALTTLAIATPNIPAVYSIEELYPSLKNDKLGDYIINYSFEGWGADFGYSTKRYFTEDERITAEWDWFGERAAQIIKNRIAAFRLVGQVGQEEITPHVLVATHAICANFIALHLCSTLHEELRTVELGECDRIVVTLDDDGTETDEHRKLPAE